MGFFHWMEYASAIIASVAEYSGYAAFMVAVGLLLLVAVIAVQLGTRRSS